MNARLEQIFAKNIDHIVALQAEEFKKLIPSSGTIILFGAGPLGQHTAKRLQSLTHQFNLFFCDNKSVGEKISGIPVLRPEEAFEHYSDTALFVVTIYNSSSVIAQLKAANCRYIASVPALYRAFPEYFMPFFALAQPYPVFQQEEAVRKAYQLLADEESRQQYLRLLSWYTAESYQNLPRGTPAADTYFPSDLIRPLRSERLVDCGAYDGDVIKIFLSRWQEGFERIAAFEPDADNRERLHAYIKTLSPSVQQKTDIYPFALGARPETVRFASQGNVASSVTLADGDTVQSMSLDHVLADFHPTFIKMDIEGAEPDALTGAKTILQNDAPALAICLYHDLAHLWQIPLQIHEANPAYRLYLRRHAEDCWETVCYAIPPGR